MRRHDITAKRNCAVRGGGPFIPGAMLRVAVLRKPGAIIRTGYVSD
jgi:hypothetical protein